MRANNAIRILDMPGKNNLLMMPYSNTTIIYDRLISTKYSTIYQDDRVRIEYQLSRTHGKRDKGMEKEIKGP